MGRLTFNADDPCDVLHVKDVLSKMDPTDRKIAEMRMRGYTQAEIGAAVGLDQRSVGRRIGLLRKYFTGHA